MTTDTEIKFVLISCTNVVEFTRGFLKGQASYYADTKVFAESNSAYAETPENWVAARAELARNFAEAAVVLDAAIELDGKKYKKGDSVELRFFQIHACGLKAKTVDDYAKFAGNALIGIWNGYTGANMQTAAKKGTVALATGGEEGKAVAGYSPPNNGSGGSGSKTISKADLLAMVADIKEKAAKLIDGDIADLRNFAESVSKLSTKKPTDS